MNFNAYRGILEYRYSPKSGMPYIINELLLENYVAGVAEASNSSPIEYLKALQIAARTYAYTNISTKLPTTARMFDVYGSTNDQLYLGYNFESFSPRIAFYTGGTRGLMVTYNEKPVTTNYFTRSNGKTKTKKGMPWLVSVKAKYDKGFSELGHGYGMSNHDAVLRAKKDGWSYNDILTYYYSGTKVVKMY
jgi:peptidoglycan hydrolase-like amidase